MNYSIQYGKNTWENTRAPKRKSRAINWAILILSVSIAMQLLLPDLSRRFFTEEYEAFSNAIMVVQNTKTDSWSDKLVTFCQEILHGYENSNPL